MDTNKPNQENLEKKKSILNLELSRKQKIISSISGTVLLILLFSGIYFEKYKSNDTELDINPNDKQEEVSKPSKTDSATNEKKAELYTDPGTGEQVVTIPNKTPENTEGHNITMLGFSHLVNDYGMTLEQVKSLQTEFEDYSSQRKEPFHEISITLKEVKTDVDPKTGIAELEFPIVLDRTKTETAEVKYFGLDDPELIIKDSKNKVIYNSESF